MSKFTHLHVHSEFSLLDGMSKIKKLIARTKEFQQDSLAITDHGVMYGAIEFYKQCKKEGVKPILGCEIYVAGDSRLEKKRQDAFHLLLLAKDKQGYENLMKIVTISQTDGFYYKPRADKEILALYHEGIIATSACPLGRVQRLLVDESYEDAKKEVVELEQIFGKGNFFLELQRHHLDRYAKGEQVPDQIKTELLQMHEENIKAEKGLLQLSKELDIPYIATNDTHYVDKDDAQAQDAIVCIQTGKFISDIARMRYIDTPDFFLKSTQEMQADFSDLPDAITNTQLIAEKVDIDITLGAWFFPKFDLPEGQTSAQVLREMAYKGAAGFYGDPLPEEITKRLDYELEVIEKKGYSPYFLLYSFIVKHTDEVGIYTNTRGSAAGCLVSYCCGITTVDPIRYHLPFERFLNPFRPSPPDIDLDISDDRRDDLINWLKSVYGDDRVAQICTFGTMKAKAAVRDVGRVLGLPYSKVDAISKMIPEGSQGFPMTLAKAIESTPALQGQIRTDADTSMVIQLAKKVEGNVRHISVHAAAVVIAPDALTKFTPLQQESGGGDKLITQYEMHACEDVGLIKLDILGIRNLSILANAVTLIEKSRGIKIAIKKVPLDDKKTFDMLAMGQTFGVFQLSGSGMTKYLVDLHPERIEDLMAMVALYRPGPISSIPEYIARKRDPKKISYFDPRMESFLQASYGILTYQDDVLYCSIELAGYNWEEADKFRKAIGKKIVSEMEAQHSKFVEGCVTHGMERAKAEELFKQIETFAAYGFNKAHAASYGVVAYWTAYIKANFAVEYMTALMSAESGNTDKITEAINECVDLHIKILPPDLNESDTDFTIVGNGEEGTDKAIRFGFSAIKNVGASAITAILAARKDGPFRSFTDFMYRVDQQKVNKKVLESLIGAGAMDRFGHRAQLLAYIPEVKNRTSTKTKSKETGQDSLFDALADENSSINFQDHLPEIEPMPSNELLKIEKALLGFYLSDHPVRNIIKIVANKITHKLSQLDPHYHVGQTVTIAGVLASVRTVNTKKNNSLMAFATLEDDTASADCVIFPKLFAADPDIWIADKPVLVTGKVDIARDNREKRDDNSEEEQLEVKQKITIIVDRVEPIDIHAPAVEGETYEIDLPKGTPKEQMIALNDLLKKNPGADTIVILVPNGGPTPKRITLPYTVRYNTNLSTQVNELIYGKK